MSNSMERIAEVLRSEGYLCVHKEDGDRLGEVIDLVVDAGFSVVDVKWEGVPAKGLGGEEFFAGLVKNCRAETRRGVMLLSSDDFGLLVSAIIQRCEQSESAANALWNATHAMFKRAVALTDKGFVKEELMCIIGNLQELVKKVDA